MKRKELERLEEERKLKEEEERLAREAAAREAERKRLEEVRMKNSTNIKLPGISITLGFDKLELQAVIHACMCCNDLF